MLSEPLTQLAYSHPLKREIKVYTFKREINDFPGQVSAGMWTGVPRL